MKIAFVAYLIAAVILSGCAGVRVSKADQDGVLKGLPFRLKVPVLMQETKLTQTGYLVQFQIDDDDTRTPASSVPKGGIFVACASPSAIRATVDKIMTAATAAKTLAQAGVFLENNLHLLVSLDATDPSQCREIVANSLKQETRLSEQEYYITNVIPLFGSGSGAYELNPDGSLSKAQTSVTDDTAKTLLGLFPIKELLVRRWTAGPDGAAAVLETKKPTELHVDVTLTPRVTLYTMRKELANGAIIASPLSLEDARTGANAVHLVSVERNGEADASRPDPKAFSVQGTVTQPRD